ncbi:hypothetical protein PENTCL1PPCAC_26648 [Pristionchus entomophagus]|uniref:BED-type domain-containing protein n=1 Tax=Pristionchus entomophagus TaxID=358040 RepID=A0AAV5UC19_9BILA|nr:hypothetical protein PENTCL1PPCAC_26648 [Pristionchus entomophagus]
MTQREATPLKIVDAWRNKCHWVNGHSNDALVAVLTKSIDILSIMLTPSNTSNNFDRALASLDLERINSLQFDARRDTTVRDLIYGVMQSFHITMQELARRGWQPHWRPAIDEFKTEPAPDSTANSVSVPIDTTMESESIDSSTGRRDEREEIFPLFNNSQADVEEEPVDYFPEEPEVFKRYPLIYSVHMRGVRVRSAMEREEEVDDSDTKTAKRMAPRTLRSFSRAKSQPPGRINEMKEVKGGGGGGGVIKKRRMRMTKKRTMGCTLCEWHSGNSPGSVIAHLRDQHGESPTSAGIYFRCKCGFDSRSNNHRKSYKENTYTMVRDEDERFAPKRQFSNNLSRRGMSETRKKEE